MQKTASERKGKNSKKGTKHNEEKSFRLVPQPKQTTSNSPSAAFKAMTRDKYLVAHVIKKPEGPPVGYYWPGHKAIDADLRTPLYGSPDLWDGHLYKQSIKIKEKEFARSVASVCPRIDRALVKYREDQIEGFRMALG